MKLTPGGFATWTKQLLTLRNCAPVFVFEDGYHLQVSAECITAVERCRRCRRCRAHQDPGALDAAAFAASSGHGQLAEHAGDLRPVVPPSRGRAYGRTSTRLRLRRSLARARGPRQKGGEKPRGKRESVHGART